jgi:CHASE3 domain sensor protein
MTVLIANRTSMGRPDAEKIADKIVSARDNVVHKVNEIQRQVNQKMEEAKQRSLEAAGETRKAAVTAGWWLVATAILSGIASVFGGMFALEGFIF